jgi:hypothetical protein
VAFPFVDIFLVSVLIQAFLGSTGLWTVYLFLCALAIFRDTLIAFPFGSLWPWGSLEALAVWAVMNEVVTQAAFIKVFGEPGHSLSFTIGICGNTLGRT